MVDVASLPLCKELYELSGWDNDLLSHNQRAPRYTLDYLLRKLPKKLEDGWLTLTPMVNRGKDDWGISYDTDEGENLGFQYADTPANAAAKLAIELFKQGVLTRDGDA